jgi:hypothetical protein
MKNPPDARLWVGYKVDTMQGGKWDNYVAAGEMTATQVTLQPQNEKPARRKALDGVRSDTPLNPLSRGEWYAGTARHAPAEIKTEGHSVTDFCKEPRWCRGSFALAFVDA